MNAVQIQSEDLMEIDLTWTSFGSLLHSGEAALSAAFRIRSMKRG